MLIWDKILPLFNTPGEPSGGVAPSAAPSSPPTEPPANPTDSNPEAISSSDEWVLGHFDALRGDDELEDIDPVEPSAPVVTPPQVSVQAERPEGITSPSPQTREAPKQPAALATPAQVVSAPSPVVPVVGATVNQPVSQPLPAAALAVDPASIMSNLAAAMAAQRDALINELAKRYEMSEADADKLGFTPEQARHLALIQARTQFEAVSSITQMQAEQLPVLLDGHAHARSENQRKEDAFFGQWPALRQAPKGELAKVFQAVNTLHPNLRGEEWFKKAGEMAHVSLGIPIQAPQASNGQVTQQVRTPGPIVRQTNGLAHLPAGTSTAPAPVAPQMSEAERFFRLLQATDAGEFET